MFLCRLAGMATSSWLGKIAAPAGRRAVALGGVSVVCAKAATLQATYVVGQVFLRRQFSTESCWTRQKTVSVIDRQSHIGNLSPDATLQLPS